jgi:predicted amidohydrolase YtcJ
MEGLMRLIIGIAVYLLFSAPALQAQSTAPLVPEFIYLNGRVLTVDEPFTVAEAFAIKGDKFIAVGSNDDIRALARAGTQQVDLRGHTVIPGLMDNHNHQIWKSRNLHRGVSMAGVRSIPEILERLKSEAAKLKRGRVVIGSGDWELPGRRIPTRAELDETIPNNPVFLFHTGRNNASLNSASLKVLGIDFSTTDWGSFPILRDQRGEPTGELFRMQ